MRLVADTNVLVSAVEFLTDPPQWLYRLAARERGTMLTSDALLEELGDVLARKFSWPDARVARVIAEIRDFAEVVEPSERVSDVTDDPSDNRVLEAALAGQADVIVSGDRHLLRLGEWRGVRILSPRAFLDEFGDLL